MSRAQPWPHCTACSSGLLCASCSSDDAPPASESAQADRLLQPDTEIIKGTVPRNGTLASFLAPICRGARRARRPVIARSMDPRKLRAEQPLHPDALARRGSSGPSTTRWTRIITSGGACLSGDAARTRGQRRGLQTGGNHGRHDRPDHRETPSLFERWRRPASRRTVGLNSPPCSRARSTSTANCKPGDAFRVAFQKITRENGTVAYGNICGGVQQRRAAPRGFRFVLPDGQGRLLRRRRAVAEAFLLKSPLKFEPRITSRFSYSRRHPVLNIQRAHLGIDYAARSVLRWSPCRAVSSRGPGSRAMPAGSSRSVTRAATRACTPSLVGRGPDRPSGGAGRTRRPRRFVAASRQALT